MNCQLSIIHYPLLRFVSCLTAMLLTVAAWGQYRSEVWCPDRGDGTYVNPVINADYSDPDVICVGDDYYLTASSFNCMPGLPILHSRDLVNWQIIGHALTRQFTADNSPSYPKPEHGNGVWAPCLRYHDGWFYIYWGDPDRGVFMVRTQQPDGKWQEPVLVVEGKGIIDTTPLWDDDGRCYLANGWAGSRCGFNSVLSVRELSADGTKAISEPVIVFDGGNANHTAEGPKLYKRDGWYWIFCPAGGVATGWQLAMRSRSPYGPYMSRRVMDQGKSAVNGPHQGAWVHTAQGEDWFLHFQDKGCYGRVVHLQPLTWSNDGWPVIGQDDNRDGCGEPVMSYRKPKSNASVIVNPEESDEFNLPAWGKQWQWQADYQEAFGMPTADGTLRLYTHRLGDGSLWDAPNLLLQKTPADRFTATAKLRIAAKGDHQYGGLVMMGRDYQALVAERIGDDFVLQLLTAHDADRGKQHTVQTIATLKPTERDPIPYQPAIYLTIYLRIKVVDGRCSFFYSTNGRQFREASTDFAMREGKWIGAKIGFVAEETNSKGNRGWIDADWFRISRAE